VSILQEASGQDGRACSLMPNFGGCSERALVIRDLHADLWREAGCAPEKERSPAAFPGLRPADILVHNLFPSRPTAIDFTLWTRLQFTVDELDQAVRYKRRQYTAPCETEGAGGRSS